MQPNSWFKKSDDNKERFDNFEGALTNQYFENSVIEIKAPGWKEWKKLRTLRSNFNLFQDTSNIYSYSLYSLELSDLNTDEAYKINSRMAAFGSHFLMIRNVSEFLKRITTYLDTKEFEYCYGAVTYYNLKNPQAELTLFHKPEHLNHQKEFRIIVKAKCEKPLQFKVGSLEDFSDVYESKILSKFLLKR